MKKIFAQTTHSKMCHMMINGGILFRVWLESLLNKSKKFNAQKSCD